MKHAKKSFKTFPKLNKLITNLYIYKKMEQTIDKNASLDLKIPENVNYLLEEILNNILKDKQNKDSVKLFFDAIGDNKFQKCIVKTGFVSGEYIVFNCKCLKNGNGNIVNEIVKGMENKERYLFFMMGLNPNFFYFNTDYIVNEIDYIFFSFKLFNV